MINAKGFLNDSNSTFTAYIATKYNGSKEELIANKLGLAAIDITQIEMERKPHLIRYLNISPQAHSKSL